MESLEKGSRELTGSPRSVAVSGAEVANSLGKLATRFWEFQCHEYPLLAIQAGLKTADAVLLREAPEDFERRFKVAGDFEQALEQIPEQGLDAQSWATHRLLRRELDDLRDLHRVRAHQRPSLFPMGPEFWTIYFANTAALTHLEGAELYVERLAGLVGYWPQVIANLGAGHAAGLRYPQQDLKNAAASVRAAVSGEVDALAWFSPFRRTALKGARTEHLAERARRVIRSDLVPALTAYAEFLEGPLAKGARESLGCTDSLDGEEFYRVQMRHFTTTGLSADEVHEMGKREVARLQVEMESAAVEAGFEGNLPGYRRYLNTDPQFVAPSKEALLEQMEVLSKRIDFKIPAFFGRIPRITYGLQMIPEAAAALLPPAYAQPNPADRSGPGVHWITSIPSKAPSFMHLPLALHEAWPGHLMHLALIQEMDELPEFRRFGALRYSACLEGWALYCEGLGVEMGLYQTPHQTYGRLDMEMWRACRLVVDTGLHTRGWTRNEAITYMTAHMALPLPTIESEVDRYVGMPAQALAYQIGMLKIRELRAQAQARLGECFDVRAFHDHLLAAGPVTLPVLERLMGDFPSRSPSASGA
jgi:uncharacterized protein (DUF885 family)